MSFEIINSKALIQRENLDPNLYTVSLLKEGFNIGIVDKQTIEGIQAQIMLVLRDLIMRYTKGESTSVKVETAERILASIYYCLDTCMCSFKYPEESIAFLKSLSIKEVYDKGVGIVSTCVAETQSLFDEIKKKKLYVPLELYNSTIDEALPEFFKNYGVIFGAHETICDMDYPLAFDDMNVLGIFYIRQYLEKLKLETLFCSFFTNEDLTKLLDNYGRVHKIDYRKSPLNLFDIVISNAIFSVISGNDADNPNISMLQYGILVDKFVALDKSAITALVDGAVESMLHNLNIVNYDLINYIQLYKTNFTQRVLKAAEHSNLRYMVITGDDSVTGSSIIFEEGNRMCDNRFRSVVIEITGCADTADKIDIIKANIHSMEDFMDILKADCLFGDEFRVVFGTLSDMELAMLGKILFFEELRNGPLVLSSAINLDSHNYMEWQTAYTKFIRSTDEARVKSIEKLINEM